MKIIRTVILLLLLQGFAWSANDQELSIKQQYGKGKAAVERNDYISALAALLPLAEQGDASMQVVVGNFYDVGKGDIPQNFNKAAYWYHKAALQNIASAQYNLGVMYSHGQGVPEDHTQAYMWLSISIANGMGTLGIEARDEVAQYMTSEQVAEGNMLTKEWLAENPPSPYDPLAY
jgi:TPR repeat protein